jgi:hypothetical protein
MRSQVRHSKVRSSKPSLPGEIRINPILCSQVGQDGRSPIDDVITHTLTEDGVQNRRFRTPAQTVTIHRRYAAW